MFCFGSEMFSAKYFTYLLYHQEFLEARIHVNRLCLAARVPLIESGSSGYLGQVGK